MFHCELNKNALSIEIRTDSLARSKSLPSPIGALHFCTFASTVNC